MLQIDKDGVVINPRIKPKRKKTLEQGEMKTIHGIIVHQTGGSTAQSTFNSYESSSANGAHFLIDKDGTIYQTASLYQKTLHVGKLKSRCVLEKRCAPAELKALKNFNPSEENKREMTKEVPDRFPSNKDSVGIELVGKALPDKKTGELVYEPVTNEQNASLEWLIRELCLTLKISMREIFRHPDVSRKNQTEASTAKW